MFVDAVAGVAAAVVVVGADAGVVGAGSGIALVGVVGAVASLGWSEDVGESGGPNLVATIDQTP